MWIELQQHGEEGQHNTLFCSTMQQGFDTKKGFFGSVIHDMILWEIISLDAFTTIPSSHETTACFAKCLFLFGTMVFTDPCCNQDWTLQGHDWAQETNAICHQEDAKAEEEYGCTWTVQYTQLRMC